MRRLDKLVEAGGASLGKAPPDFDRFFDAYGPGVGSALKSLLQRKNGFYAFEGALHVLSDLGTIHENGLFEWNENGLWRGEYDGMAEGAVYFAEDVFGGQFCVREGSICTFDPETGGFEVMAPDLEEWANQVLEDYGMWTGHPIAHAWQAAHGRIPLGSRLVPITPFVLGGEFAAENVHAVEAVKGMQFRASIAVQIRDLPDGAAVTLRSVD